MHHFDYVDGWLNAEGVPLERIAKEVGTPCYVYSTATLERHFRVYSEAFGDAPHLICYALKANSNQAVIRTLAKLGSGADVVSGGELKRALLAGVPASRITFSGVAKTYEELEAAVRADILCFNVESVPELFMLSDVASRLGLSARIAVRVNPDVDAKTHKKITTGKSENKFGIPMAQAVEVYALAATLPGLDVYGVDMHIGSQITDLAPFDEAYRRLAAFVVTLREQGHTIDHIDIGGGLGIPYKHDEEAPPLPEAYARIVLQHLGGLGARLVLEPGRLIAGNAGLLLSRVILVKEGLSKTFVMIDAGMNDLIRPTLYEAHHALLPVEEALQKESRVVDVVGPVCESGDFQALDRPMACVRAGDLVALMSAGAYGAVQASTYNTRPLVPEVLVKGNHYAVIRPRVEVDTLIGLDVMPNWL